MIIRKVFISGGTGYLGRSFIPELLKRGHEVRALARDGSQSKLPTGCLPILGNALDKASFVQSIQPADTFVQLVGVSHPSPAKASQFRSVDLVSARASIAAAVEAGVKHFVYVSVAQPSPIMKDYIEVRAEAEALIRQSGLNTTILRPWYVLGPGHRWPYLLIPVYRFFELIPAMRASVQRLGLVTLQQMVHALLESVENPCQGIRFQTVPQIRQFGGVQESLSGGV